ncbi:MAG: NAD(P)H:quinone oxidoreductase [Pseudomonadota bacterium]
MADTNVLIVYDSRLGSVRKMARLIARGVAKVEGAQAIVRCVTADDDSDGDAEVTLDELKSCDGLIIGSPTRFGNMSHRLKAFLDSTTSLWMSGALVDKPAAVFTSSSSMHGGQESTLLSMQIPLLHHGMIIVGIPYSEEALKKTKTGGTPYGASHVAGTQNTEPISDEEKKLCLALGARVASVATKMQVS